MVYVGFGFLMVFLRRHSWTSVGYNFLIAAYSCQLTIILSGFWHMAIVTDKFTSISLDIPSLILGDFGAATVLISFGALLGKINLLQLWTLATLEVIFYTLNEALCAGHLQAVDMGGSMYVHTFGAFFGIAAAYFFKTKECKEAFDPAHPRKNDCVGGYVSQYMAMLGTLFLFCFWPSFNGALAMGYQQQRVIVNTVLAITASCITACGIARLKFGRLNMEIVLNATLAGGVAVGSASDLVVTASIAMVIGGVAGILSACGYIYLTPALRKSAGLYDTCGVLNLHGLPGILGGIVGAIAAGNADQAFELDVSTLASTFPALAGKRTVTEQGWYQLAALAVTLLISIASGAVSGLLASKVGKVTHIFRDDEHWTEHEYDLPDDHDKVAVVATPAIVSEMVR